jgi:hypothetical protein
MAVVQGLMACSLLCAIFGTFLVLDLASRNERLERQLTSGREEALRRSKGIFSDTGYFIDFEDRLVLDEIPSADFSRGSVDFIGSSNMKWATNFRNLSPDQRSLIHNFSFGSCGHNLQFHLVRYLVEQRKLLQAGGDKTLIVFGVSYHNALYEPEGFFVNLWKRHGLYTYDPSEGMSPVPVNSLYRRYYIGKVRITGFLSAVGRAARTGLRRLLRDDREIAPRQHEPEIYNRFRREMFDKDWDLWLAYQCTVFGEMMDYLRSRDVNILIILLPQGSWEANLPFEASYGSAIRDICHAKGVPLLDWSDRLDDDDFADSNHLNLLGMEKLHEAFLDIAIPHLRRTKALP